MKKLKPSDDSKKKEQVYLSFISSLFIVSAGFIFLLIVMWILIQNLLLISYKKVDNKNFFVIRLVWIGNDKR